VILSLKDLEIRIEVQHLPVDNGRVRLGSDAQQRTRVTFSSTLAATPPCRRGLENIDGAEGHSKSAAEMPLAGH
jgi:hypothetical protein